MLKCLNNTGDVYDRLTLFPVNNGSFITLDCKGLRHIVERDHLSNPPSPAEWTQFQKCVERTLLAEVYPDAHIPNSGRTRYNTYTDVQSVVIFSPDKRIVTAYTTGANSKDWKGCCR